MSRKCWMKVWTVLLVTALVPFTAARADIEVATPDGRKALLKNDGTWSYVETEKPVDQEKVVVTGEGVMTLERMVELGGNCQIAFRLQNDTNYEIRSIVPRFVVYRKNGAAYEGRTLGFQSINPGNSLVREALFRGISCADVGRIQVSGGERCTMGDLDQFSYTGGACLDRVRVVPSDLVRFDK